VLLVLGMSMVVNSMLDWAWRSTNLFSDIRTPVNGYNKFLNVFNRCTSMEYSIRLSQI